MALATKERLVGLVIEGVSIYDIPFAVLGLFLLCG